MHKVDAALIEDSLRRAGLCADCIVRVTGLTAARLTAALPKLIGALRVGSRLAACGACLKQKVVHRLVASFSAIVIVGLVSVAHAQVPTPQDIAACNSEAQLAVRKGPASKGTAEPITKDQSRAAEARRTESSASRAEDPQLGGMDAEGAKDPAYQAAYRTCMRKAGF